MEQNLLVLWFLIMLEDFMDSDGCLAGRDISVTSLIGKGEESHALRVHSKPYRNMFSRCNKLPEAP